MEDDVMAKNIKYFKLNCGQLGDGKSLHLIKYKDGSLQLLTTGEMLKFTGFTNE